MSQAVSRMSEVELSVLARERGEEGFGALSTARGALPLLAMEVKAEISGLFAEVSLAQTFQNAFEDALEATYVFPLPDRAAVTRFRMEVNGRVIEGVLKERGQARMEYDQAIRDGHRAAITEEDRPGVFTLRVGNLMPRERAVVRLTLSGPLALDDGEATFRFPLVVAPRYIPGRPLEGESVGLGTALDTDEVPDASRITPPVLLPGLPNPVALSLSVSLDPLGLPLSELRSSLHVLEEARDRLHRARIFRLLPGERLDRDFILRFRLGEGSLVTRASLCPDPAGDAGTLLLCLLPPAAGAPRPRDVVLVLDRSGSMNGWKMVAARRAAARIVDSLGAADRFAVFGFDNQIVWPLGLGEGLVSATDRHRFQAVEFLASLEAQGGTEMARPLARAAELLSGGHDDRERALVLVTDGQVGNEDQILRELSPRLRNVRVYTIGVDRAVNAAFLRRLSELGGGLSELVESEERLDEVMERIHRRVGRPVLGELLVEGTGLELERDTLVPARPADLFAGAPLLLFARYRRAGAAPRLFLSARTPEGERWRSELEVQGGGSRALTTAWARGQVRALEDAFVSDRGDRASLEQRIVRTSLDFGVLCRFTAYVAVDTSEVANRGGAPRPVVQPVEKPSGWAQAQGAGGVLLGRTAAGVITGELRSVAPGPGSPAKKKDAAALAEVGAATEGFMDRLRRAVAPRAQKQEDAPPAPPPPRQEARTPASRPQEILTRALAVGRDARGLAELQRLLRLLLDELAREQPGRAALQPLRDLLSRLERPLPAGAAELEALWVEATRVLTTFGGGAPGRREGFWRR